MIKTNNDDGCLCSERAFYINGTRVTRVAYYTNTRRCPTHWHTNSSLVYTTLSQLPVGTNQMYQVPVILHIYIIQECRNSSTHWPGSESWCRASKSVPRGYRAPPDYPRPRTTESRLPHTADLGDTRIGERGACIRALPGTDLSLPGKGADRREIGKFPAFPETLPSRSRPRTEFKMQCAQ